MVNTTTNKLKKNTVITVKFSMFDFICMLVIAHGQMPVVGYYMPSAMYLVLVLAAFVMSVIKISRKASAKKLFTFLPLFIIPLLNILISISSSELVAIFESKYSVLQTFTIGLIATVYILEGDKKAIKKMIVFVLLLTVITSITTIIGCIKYYEPSRVLAKLGAGDPEYELYTSQNIGSFSFVYGSVVLVPIIDVLFKTKNINRIFAIASIIIIGIMTVKTEYTIALIMYIILILVFLIPKITTRKLLMLLVIVVGIFIFARPAVTNIVSSFAKSEESNVRSSRYEYIEDVLEGNNNISKNENHERVLRYYKSWNTFINTYGLGSWDGKTVGGHSYVLDNLGIYGFLGFVIMLFEFIYYYVVILRKNRKCKYYASILLGFIMVIILSAVNPKLNTFCLMFMIPLTCSKVFGFNFEERASAIAKKTDEDTLGC